MGLLGELYIPSILFLIYGLAGLLLLFQDSTYYGDYQGVKFQARDILLGFGVISITMFAVVFGFRLSYRGKWLSIYEHAAPKNDVVGGANLILYMLLIFDISVRLANIQTGYYFSWMRADMMSSHDTYANSFMMLQGFLAPLLAVLVYWKSRAKPVWKWLLLLLLFLVLLEGDRSSFYSIIIAIVLTSLLLNLKVPSLKRLVFYLAIGLAIVMISSSIIVDIRQQYRLDRASILKNPAAMIERTVLTYIPNAIFGWDRQGPVLEGAGFQERLVSWQAAFASQINRLRSGWSHLPTSDFLRSLELPIPEVIYSGEKPSIEAGNFTAEWLSLGLHRHHGARQDPATTVFTNIYLYFGLFGSLLLGLIIGLFNGMIAKFLVIKYQYLGAIIFIGGIELMSVMANSFAAFLVNFRHLVLLVSLIVVAVWFSSVWRK